MKEATNFRVVCYPASGYLFEEAEEKHANSLQAEIKRHCDHLKDCHITRDFICSFCGRDWEEEENGEPTCCNKAIEKWETKKVEESK